MRVLITGASGFVGSCLARRLLREEHSVHVFIRKGSNTWRLEDIRKDITEHRVDLRDAALVEQTVGKIMPQIIYHLATYGGFAGQKDVMSILGSNFLGTVNLLRACEQTGFDYFVNTGSSSEYGIKSRPMVESDILEPIEAYGVSKSASTLFCQSEGAMKKLPIVTLRLFSPYGPWDDPKRLIPYLIKSILRGEAPTLSTPESVRDYIFIDDVLNAYTAVVDHPFYGEVFNIGSGTQHTVGAIVAAAKGILRNGPEPVWGSVEKQRPEPSSWVANVDKARKKFNWKPSTMLKEGLEQTITWMKSNLSLYP
jgi:nucleoside-diphosphate-sugar epimerase